MKYACLLMIFFLACESSLETKEKTAEQIDLSIDHRRGGGISSDHEGETRSEVWIDGNSSPNKNRWTKYTLKSDGHYRVNSWSIITKHNGRWYNIPLNNRYAFISGNVFNVKYSHSGAQYKIIAYAVSDCDSFHLDKEIKTRSVSGSI